MNMQIIYGFMVAMVMMVIAGLIIKSSNKAIKNFRIQNLQIGERQSNLFGGFTGAGGFFNKRMYPILIAIIIVGLVLFVLARL